jgi:hypothetical protein
MFEEIGMYRRRRKRDRKKEETEREGVVARYSLSL